MFCIDLGEFLSNKMKLEGITDNPGALQKRYDEIMKNKNCPLMDSCKKYEKTVKRRNRKPQIQLF